jgi:hypothetical protein
MENRTINWRFREQCDPGMAGATGLEPGNNASEFFAKTARNPREYWAKSRF